MLAQTNLFGLAEIIIQPSRKTAHSSCGCFTDTTDSERKQAAIKAHLLKGKTLTVLQAIKQYHTTELRKVICRLKNQGVDIVGEWHEENGKRKYKIYRLNGTA
jgi:hypothetical protein